MAAVTGGDLPALLEAAHRAMKKSGVDWVEVPGRAPRAVWGLWSDGGLHLVTGGREQEVPGLPECAADSIEVIVATPSPATGALLVRWRAAVSRLAPDGPGWRGVVPLLAAKRLNLPAGDDPATRWARESALLRLTPVPPPLP